MLDLMLDCETMGTGPDAALVSIGAVFFSERDGALGDTFYRVINLATAVRSGGQIDPGTVMWWLAQDDAARTAIRTGTSDITEVLTEFQAFVKRGGPDVRVWGCSPTFDCLKVERSMKRVGLTVPWKYFNERDYRTVRERNKSIKLNERTGLHNALDDAKFQALHLIKIRNEKASA